VSLLSSDLKTLSQSTYLGGSSGDWTNAIAVSGSKVYVAGYTMSRNFPGTAGGAQPVSAGWIVPFVTLLTGDLRGADNATSIPASVPTMTEWGMILFMLLAGLGSVYYLKRQRTER